MKLTPFDNLPIKMRNSSVEKYYKLLNQKSFSLILKRLIDILICSILIVIASPFLLILAILIKLTSKGNVLYLQNRIGQDMKPFYIYKFRTMVADADKKGLAITTGNDSRITSFGSFLRKINMDEIPQLFNVFKGDMSIIGTRPEVLEYVDCYSDEMLATLLLPPGMLSLASIKYKNENDLLTNAENPHQQYIDVILPDKMKYNLEYLSKLSVKEDMKLIGSSIACLFKK